MASSDHQIEKVAIFPLQQQNQHDLEVEDEEELDNETEYESDEDLNSNSSADPSAVISTVTVTVAVPPPPDQPPVISFIDSSDLKRQRVESSSLLQPQQTQVSLPQIAHQAHVITVASAAPVAAAVHHNDQQQQQARKQLQQPVDESRKLFQRLWTDEDEIELLQGFYEYTSERGINNNNVHHHNDITLFYDQIKSKLQLEFNRNQLVEKLRRLKKKYRNNVARIGSGKEFVFKIPHDFATFDISRRIWGDSSSGSVVGCATVNVVASAAPGVLGFDGGIDDEDLNRKHGISVTNNNHHSINDTMMFDLNNNNTDKKAFVGANVTPPRSRKRPISSSPHVVKVEDKTGVLDEKCIATPISSLIHRMIEETVISCLSPLLKEALSNTKNGDARGSMLSPISLSYFGGSSSSSIGNSLLGGEVVEEKWRKQQILELEVYSQRLDLVQDQIKATLDELRSAGSS